MRAAYYAAMVANAWPRQRNEQLSEVLLMDFVQPAEPCTATRRRNKFQQRADSLALVGELSLAGAAYRIS
jgi:hypothetical protein